jgi:3-deoxy-D-manno-octulosonate 8-phosphate phosphatase (KDO 8-P phosphatase)
MSAHHTTALHIKLAQIKLLLCDVDGVLTDGTITIGDDKEFKRFNIQDGLGLRLLQKHGVKVGWISHRPSPATRQRALELKVDHLHQEAGSKLEAAKNIFEKEGLSWDEVCYIGDDIVDLGVMARAGMPVAVANAVLVVRDAAQYITTQPGGQGAVREVAEMILKAQNKWPAIIDEFTDANETTSS